MILFAESWFYCYYRLFVNSLGTKNRKIASAGGRFFAAMCRFKFAVLTD